jgi:hypothetical protein
MRQSFLDYFIRRKHSLPEQGDEIEFILATPAGLRRARIGRELGLRVIAVEKIMGIPVAMGSSKKPVFTVKRKDTGKLEPWFEDYLLNPDPDWQLMDLLNRRRADNGRAHQALSR